MAIKRLYLEAFHGKSVWSGDPIEGPFSAFIIGPFDCFVVTYGNMLRMIYKQSSYTIAIGDDGMLTPGVFPSGQQVKYSDWAIHYRKPKHSPDTPCYTFPAAINTGIVTSF